MVETMGAWLDWMGIGVMLAGAFVYVLWRTWRKLRPGTQEEAMLQRSEQQSCQSCHIAQQQRAPAP